MPSQVGSRLGTFTILTDSVKGRVSQWGLIAPKTQFNTSKITANQPLRPDEVLFKGSNAPTRYEETDYYFAHANLPEDQKLPSGDLLSALHAYISKYYSRNEAYGNQKVWKCMDETALIAFGILMEETAREVLGETGDLTFLEGGEEGGEVASPVDEEESAEMPHAEVRREGNVSQYETEDTDSSAGSSNTEPKEQGENIA
jgi:hypothetical protein